MPPSRSARAAPASTVTVPRVGLAYLSHSLKLEWRTGCGAKRVPAALARPRAREHARLEPEPITVGMPAAVAISAATTFERIPPEPERRDRVADVERRERLGVGDLARRARAPGSTRGSAV